MSSSFTGILVSAWIALYLQIPRLTLTTASYPGNPAYFNGSILKNEITDSPEVVIQRILECVENYNAELWLAKQHQELVAEYQHMLNQLPNPIASIWYVSPTRSNAASSARFVTLRISSFFTVLHSSTTTKS